MDRTGARSEPVTRRDTLWAPVGAEAAPEDTRERSNHLAILDWFRRPPRRIALPELAYHVAYFIVPELAFRDLRGLLNVVDSPSGDGGRDLYSLAVRQRRATPNPDDARLFTCHRGRIDAEWEYRAIKYPEPAPLEESALSDGTAVLAPYFSAVVFKGVTLKCFVLGQAAVAGERRTTLRLLTREANCNLGPGPEPALDTFLAAIRSRIDQWKEAES
jgi:hypothetical protein